VVYFLGGSQLAVLSALLAKGMCLDVSVTDTFPSSAITFAGGRVTFILIVAFTD